MSHAALTAKGLSEVRRATWTEIDLDARTRTIPGRPNAKIREHHVEPLWDASMQVLHRALELPRPHGMVFAKPVVGDSVMPDSTIGCAMQRAGVAVSPHGFRSNVPHVGAGARRELGGGGDQPEPPCRWFGGRELRAIGDARKRDAR